MALEDGIPVEVLNREELIDEALKYDSDDTAFQTRVQGLTTKPEELAVKPGDRTIEEIKQGAYFDVLIGEKRHTAEMDLDINNEERHADNLNRQMQSIRSPPDPQAVWSQINWYSADNYGLTPESVEIPRKGSPPSNDPEDAIDFLESAGVPVEVHTETPHLHCQDEGYLGIYQAGEEEIIVDSRVADHNSKIEAEIALEKVS